MTRALFLTGILTLTRFSLVATPLPNNKLNDKSHKEKLQSKLSDSETDQKIKELKRNILESLSIKNVKENGLNLFYDTVSKNAGIFKGNKRAEKLLMEFTKSEQLNSALAHPEIKEIIRNDSQKRIIVHPLTGKQIMYFSSSVLIGVIAFATASMMEQAPTIVIVSVVLGVGFMELYTKRKITGYSVKKQLDIMKKKIKNIPCEKAFLK